MTTPVDYSATRVMRAEPIESEIIAAAIGGWPRFPVDLDFVIDRVGATVKSASCCNSFTYFQAAGPIIYLSKTEPDNGRRRFIIAHELAHIMLRNPAAVSLMRRRGEMRLLDHEENLANRIAGALLVPDSWVEGMKRRQLGPAGLREIAFRAGLPISMLITRMAQAGIDIALLHWHRGRGTWYVVDRPGTPLFLHEHVEISALSRRALDHLIFGESEVTIDCCAKGVWMRIKGSSFRPKWQNEDVFQFLSPEKDIIF